MPAKKASSKAAPADIVVEPAERRFARAALEHAVVAGADDPPPPAEATARAAAALTEARAALTASLDELGGFSLLVNRAGLSPAEAEVLAVALALETDEWLQRLAVSLTGDRQRHHLELGMFAALFGPDHPGVAAAGPNGGLQRAAFVRLDPAGAFSRSVVRIADRVLWALAGDGMTDPDLPVTTEVIAGVDLDDADVADVADGVLGAVIVIGDDRVRRRELAARRLGREVYLCVPGVDLGDAAWAAIVREATLAAAGVIVEVDGVPDAAARRWIERANHLPWALAGRTAVELRQAPRLAWQQLDAPATEPSDEEWTAVLGDVPRQHRLSADQLEQMRIALPVNGGDFATAFRRMVSPKLETLATHIRPRHGWDDLILDSSRKAQLGDLINRYRQAHRVYDEWGVPAIPSRGLVTLFSGPSGTGKTLAAEVVAGELGLDLYKLDLSSVVSKWIGETEKNLDELFAAAGAGNFVLFFDEADALFAKRGAVSDSHDRYANLETSYLLQRLERYDGMVVMATNYEKNIDDAFMRRIHVRVDFGLPDEASRLAIWQLHSQSRFELAPDVDLAWLAKRFEIPGAAIKNALVDAAFLAAASGEHIRMAYVVRGLARELRKLGRLITREQFGEWLAEATTTDPRA